MEYVRTPEPSTVQRAIPVNQLLTLRAYRSEVRRQNSRRDMSKRQADGVVRIRLVDASPRGKPRPRWWEATYEDSDSSGGSTQGPEKDHVLHWAAQQPALEWLMQDPATGEWSPWEPVTADTCEIKVLRIPPVPCPPDTVDDGHRSRERWTAWWVCGEMSGVVESHDKEYVLAWVRARMVR
jgi:hypothetical protein